MASLTEIYNELVTEVEMEKEAQTQTESTEPAVVETTDEITKVAADWVAAGRLMAIGYVDEMTKLAAEETAKASKIKELAKKALAAGKTAGKAVINPWGAHADVAKLVAKGTPLAGRAKSLGLAGLKYGPHAAVLGGGIYGASKLMGSDKKKK